MFKYEHTTGNSDLNIRSLFELLLYSSLYLSIAAIAKAFVSSVLQEMPISPAACLILFLVTFSVYNMNRKTDESEDAINHSRRFAFTQKHAKVLMHASLAAYIVAFAIAGLHGIFAFGITAIPLVSGIFYSIPLLPHGFRYRRLKDIPVVKNLMVGLAWAVPVALLPAACTGYSIGIMTYAVGIFFFLLSFINSTVFDIRDMEGDAKSGVRTIPVMLGLQKTRILLSVLNLAGSAGVLALCSGCLAPSEMTIIVGIEIYVQSYIVFFDGSAFNMLMYDIVADGQNLLFGGLIFLSMVFVV